MPAITIHVTPGNTAQAADGASVFGQMWFELNDGSGDPGNIASFGWEALAPAVHADGEANGTAATVLTAGHVVHTARAERQAGTYAASISISQVQYEKMKSFATDPVRHGFDASHDTLNHSSIDYTWRTLQEGGLNPADFEGKVWPLATISDAGCANEPHIAGWRAPDNMAFVDELFRQSRTLLTANWKIAQLEQVHRRNQQHWNAQSALYDQLRSPAQHGVLAFDLDGDGLETRNDFSRVYFDSNNDGIKTATSWVLPDDGMLVMDRNGNGLIDNGSELFGTGTTLSDGSLARDGFEALAPQDSNGDGIINSDDANWSMLNIWRDRNQDGISQSDELSSLTQRSIASINLNHRSSIQLIGNDNRIAAAGHYTKSDGNTCTVADLRLRESRFFRQFADTPLIADEIAALPDAAGSGKVRNLRQAAAQSATLQQTLTAYAAADTRQQQQALLDQLLSDWAATAGMNQTVQERLGSRYDVIWNTIDGNDVSAGSAGAAQVAAWERRLSILDAFQGQHLLDITPHAPVTWFTPVQADENQATPGVIYINLSTQQTTALNRAYVALQESVYATLLMQTRFKSVFDQVQPRIDSHGVQMDMSTVERHFNQAIATDSVAGLSALIEFYQYASAPPGSTGWGIDTLLAQQLQHGGDSAAGRQLLAGFNVAAAPHQAGKNQLLIGTDGNEMLAGSSNHDLLWSGGGSDQLYGFGGNDLLDGGHGDDYLHGGSGNDIYLLRHGAGHDTIDNRDGSRGDRAAASMPAADHPVQHDRIHFEDVAMSDLRTIRRTGDDMVLEYGVDNSVTIKDAFAPDQAGMQNEISSFRFADGRILTTAQLLDSFGLDPIRLGHGDDVMGLSRHQENLYAGDGDDTIDGGAGNDWLRGQNGNDLLFGNSGEDILDGGHGNDLLIGGHGNDIIIAAGGADVIAFNRGDGADIVRLDKPSPGTTVSLGNGIAYADLFFEKSADHLILNLGMHDSMTFQNWYSDRGHIDTLQIVRDGSSDDDATSPSGLHNQKITQFDFSALVTQFDAALAGVPGASRWSLSSGLLQAHLGGSDSEAIGGERVSRYGRGGQVVLPGLGNRAIHQPQPAPPQATAGNFAMTIM